MGKGFEPYIDPGRGSARNNIKNILEPPYSIVEIHEIFNHCSPVKAFNELKNRKQKPFQTATPQF